MKIAPTLTKPPDSGTFFRVYTETPEHGYRTFYLDSQTHRVIWNLLCKLSVSKREAPPGRQVSTGNPERLEKIVRYIEANLERKVSLDQLARHVGMSNPGLSRFCSRHLPGGFSSFLIALRLDRATHLLLSSSYTILYIALSCGFESISHFNKQFRKRFGVSPSDFRKETSKTTSVSK